MIRAFYFKTRVIRAFFEKLCSESFKSQSPAYSHLKNLLLITCTLREKCPCPELFWSAFFRIWTEYREILRISPYSVPVTENVDQNDSEYGQFLRSGSYKFTMNLSLYSKYYHMLDLPEIVQHGKTSL